MPASAQLLVIVAALVLFWAVAMRPARNQQKKVARLQEELEVGQEVILSAGIFGVVRALNGPRVDLEIAPGTVVTVARQVVVRRAEDVADQPGPARGREGTDGHTDPDEGRDTGSTEHKD